jgi:hypothetical protein
MDKVQKPSDSDHISFVSVELRIMMMQLCHTEHAVFCPCVGNMSMSTWLSLCEQLICIHKLCSGMQTAYLCPQSIISNVSLQTTEETMGGVRQLVISVNGAHY